MSTALPRSRPELATSWAPPLKSLSQVASVIANQSYLRRGVPQSAETIRVVLVDDHNLLRSGLCALLRGTPDIEVIAEAGTGEEALKIVQHCRPHVVVMDLDMPGEGGLAATRVITSGENTPRVLVLSVHSEEEKLIAALQSGANGYLMKDAAERELIDAIRVVASGDVYVRPRVARLLASSLRPPNQTSATEAAKAQFASLSEREQTVVRMIAEGYNGPEIGKKLGITAKTVDTYKQRIEDKLGFSHRTDYVRFALTLDLLRRQ